MLHQYGNFSPNMVAGCIAALALGITEDDAFAIYVLKHMGGVGCTATLVETVDVSYFTWPALKEVRDRLTAKIAVAPRGHYALVQSRYQDGRLYWKTFVSDGSGQLAVGGRFDIYDVVPEPRQVMTKVVVCEVALCRMAIAQKRRVDEDVKAVDDFGFKVGMTYQQYWHPNSTRPYDSMEIMKVNPESGSLKIAMMRQGSNHRTEVEIGAVNLARTLRLSEKSADRQAIAI